MLGRPLSGPEMQRARMPWSGPVANCRGWVGGTHYVPKTGLGGFDWVIPGAKEVNPQAGTSLRASRPAYQNAAAASRQSAPETTQAVEYPYSSDTSPYAAGPAAAPT